MPNLAPWNLFYPNQLTVLTPLAARLTQIVQSVSDALTLINGGTARKVASVSARDTLYPTPAQGDSVYRTDLGYQQRYYTLYNSSTNPGGATPAGWYPVPGTDIYRSWIRTATDSWSASTRTNICGASWTNMPAGVYRIITFGNVSNTTDGPGDLWTSLNGTDISHVYIDQQNGAKTPWNRNQYTTDNYGTHPGGTMTIANDSIHVGGGTNTISAGAYIYVYYVGPSR